MVSGLAFAALLAVAPIGGAAIDSGAVQADSSAALDQTREDALEAEGGEVGLFVDEIAPRAPSESERLRSSESERLRSSESERLRSTGRLRWTGSAYALGGALAMRRLTLEGLLAREPAEPRLVDDRYARLAWRPREGLEVMLGRVAPDVGAGLVLGPPSPGTRAPARLSSARLAHALGTAPLPWATPARAAAGFEGAWLVASRGSTGVGTLLAWTRRDARRVGEAWLPLSGVRHRGAREDSARGALGERVLALAVTHGPAWLVVAHARSDPRRVPPPGATAAEQRAAVVTRGGAALEAGAALARPGARLEAAIALDARGRARSAWFYELAPPRTRTQAALMFESEASGFVPLRARPERRPHAHVGLEVRGRLSNERGGLAWRVEAHAVERRAFEPARLWTTLRLVARSGAWLELRRDAEPVRTLVAFRAAAAQGRLTIAGELRYDRRGLARETWRVRLQGRLPLGWFAACEARLGSSRSGLGWLDAEIPGGAWVQAGTAAERTRIELTRPGRVRPELAWLRTRSEAGTRSEARLGLEWAVDRTQ